MASVVPIYEPKNRENRATTSLLSTNNNSYLKKKSFFLLNKKFIITFGTNIYLKIEISNFKN